jgi:hypothetical protein
MSQSEHIAILEGETHAWGCLCGNTPFAEGFHPCDEKGNDVFSNPEAWESNLQACDRCGRIINQDTLEVVGQRVTESAS